MKLCEIVSSGFLTDEKEIKQWLKENTNLEIYDTHAYRIRDTGIVDITHFGIIIDEHVPELKVQFGFVDGDFTVALDSELMSLRGAPSVMNLSRKIGLSWSQISTLEWLPPCGIVDASFSEITKIEDVFPHIKSELSFLSLEGCKISSLVGIADLVKFPITRLNFAHGEKIDGGIGLLLIPGLTTIDADKSAYFNGFSIIQKYLGKPEDIYECQAELIDKGFEQNAIL